MQSYSKKILPFPFPFRWNGQSYKKFSISETSVFIFSGDRQVFRQRLKCNVYRFRNNLSWPHSHQHMFELVYESILKMWYSHISPLSILSASPPALLSCQVMNNISKNEGNSLLLLNSFLARQTQQNGYINKPWINIS